MMEQVPLTHRLLKQKWARARGLFLFLDFDGTLSPIVSDPKRAQLVKGVKKILQELSEHPRIRIMVISGRSLLDIRKKVGVPSLLYAGNHGFEIFSGRRYLLKKGEAYKATLRKASTILRQRLKKITGTTVEFKGLSVAIHFRNTSQVAAVKKIVTAVSQLTDFKKNLILTSGKKIMELRPHLVWHKGAAVLWALKTLHPTYLPIYIGDDVTDEDAFRALEKKGVTIRVGQNKKSVARYYVRKPEDVAKHIGRMAAWPS